MAQGVFDFQYEVENKSGGVTGLAGLPPYLEFGYVMGLGAAIGNRLKIRGGDQGWSDEQVVMALILLNLAGGDCVIDLQVLTGDDGFCRILKGIEGKGLSPKERRVLQRRLRKDGTKAFPSASSVFRYLNWFHDAEQEKLRGPEKSFIPAPNAYLRALVDVRKDFVASVQRRCPQKEATLDMHATLVQTHKNGALYCYKHYTAYQPLNTYWAEQDLVLHSEFRDGNVWAGFEQLRVFKESLDLLLPGVEKVFLRSDSAGYQHDLLRYCAESKNERFGVIEFAIGVKVTDAFKDAVAAVNQWRPLCREEKGKLVETDQQYAEVCFVPQEMALKKHCPDYRFLAIREALSQQPLTGMDDQLKLPFPTMSFGSVKYKATGVVTNRKIAGDELIWWYRKRCGKSEEAHSVMKEDLAGGKLSSGLFGANAAWWHIMILALNLNSAMKSLVLGKSWVSKRLKGAIRFGLINLPGRVIDHARALIVRLTGGHPSNGILFEMRRRILRLCESG
jgi:hypothetical protein